MPFVKIWKKFAILSSMFVYNLQVTASALLDELNEPLLVFLSSISSTYRFFTFFHQPVPFTVFPFSSSFVQPWTWILPCVRTTWSYGINFIREDEHSVPTLINCIFPEFSIHITASVFCNKVISNFFNPKCDTLYFISCSSTEWGAFLMFRSWSLTCKLIEIFA